MLCLNGTQRSVMLLPIDVTFISDFLNVGHFDLLQKTISKALISVNDKL